MDYVAGEAATPPRWMGRAGLEWLYRLASEPSRLWKRYLVEPWLVAFLVLRELALRPHAVHHQKRDLISDQRKIV